MSYIEKEKLIKADIASIENRVRHAFNQGYDLGYKEGKANCLKIPTGSTTKNDLGVDAVSRQEVLYLVGDYDLSMGQVVKAIHALPSVTPQNQVLPLCEDCHTKMDDVRRAYDNAMKQEPILDKIRAEMFEEMLSHSGTGEEVIQAYADGLKKGVEILDKYNAEDEG